MERYGIGDTAFVFMARAVSPDLREIAPASAICYGPVMALRLITALAACLGAAVAQQQEVTSDSESARPRITPTQIQAAIQKGREYKTGDKFFAKGLKGKKVPVNRYTDITFFNDWQKIAMASADANLQMREMTADEVRATGLLHAYVQTRLTLPFLSVPWSDLAAGDDILRRSNLVLLINGKVIQPLGRRIVKNHGATLFLAFDFDVSPADLLMPVTVVSIEGDDGRKHQKTVDLSGILDIDQH